MVSCVTACTTESSTPGLAVSDDPIELGRAFTTRREVRRAILEQALVSGQNQYGALRLGAYATDGGWDELEEGRPQVHVHGTDREVSDWSVEWTHEGLLEAGHNAFLHYPMRRDQRLEPLRDASAPTAGFWVDNTGWVGGLVEVDDGLAWTCASCHAQVTDDGLRVGAPNADIDIAALYRLGGAQNEVVETWRSGTIDPSDDDANNPSTIGDLRALRWQSHLHWTGTLRNSLGALATRVDTLYIVSAGQRSRPPRELAFAIAYYLWHLGEAPSEQRSDVFETNCGTCHHADGTVGAPLPWGEPHPGRGTGYHRIPSLVGVADRGKLLHDGSYGSLEQLIESGPAWHAFGRHLDGEQRAELVSYIERHFR